MKYRNLLLALGFCLATTFALAQEFRATLSGRVTDPSGALVPGAQVIVTNTSTGVSVKTKSDHSGDYTTPFLLPGPYKIEVQAPGFASYTHTNIRIETSQKVQQDVHLTLGNASETVVVTTATPLVETASASVGQVFTFEEIEDLPDNGRSPIGLAKVEFGVVPKGKNSVVQTRPFDNSAASDFSLGGGNSQSNEYLLNGVPNNQDSSRVPGFSPNMDSVQAIRTDIFQSDASFGDTSGGTVNITTKGGTNKFHGTLSEFNQFSAINAVQRWFQPANQKVPATRQNQYAATIGGPIWIPHVYNGHNHAFFFYSYEGFKATVPNPVTTTVPTDAERNGDFSALLALGSTYQLYNPFSGVIAGGKLTRTAFANNIIDPSLISPVAKAYLQYIPHANVPGNADGQNNFFSNIPTLDDYNSNAGRFDYSFNDYNKLYVEIHRSEYFRTQGNIFNTILEGANVYTVHQGGVVDYIHTFSASTTLDARGSLTRTYNATTLPSQGFDPVQLGFPGYVDANATELIIPRIQFSEPGGTTAVAGSLGNSSSNSGSLSTTAGATTAFDTFQIFAELNHVQGRHSLKIGPDLRQEKYAKLTPGAPTGSFTVNNAWVNPGSGTAIPYGGSIADFLLGLPSSGSQNIATPAMYNARYFAGFLQDDFRMLPSLTLNLGLRLEHETPITESHNNAVVGFDPTLTNSATTAAIAAYAANYSAAMEPELPVASFNPHGGLVYATDGHRSEYNTAPLYVSPRFGFAFAPPGLGGKTVLRGGFGIFVNPFNDYNTPQSYGYSTTTTFSLSTSTYATPPLSFSDPFPAAVVPILQPTGNALGANTNLGGGIQFRGPDLRVPYAERWSFDIQQQVTPNIMFDIGYLGTHQVHLSYSNSFSSTPLVPYLSRNHRADPANKALIDATHPCGQTPTQNLQCAVPNPFKGLPNVTGTYATASTITKYNLLQAFPEYSGVTQGLVSGSSSIFNELIARLYVRASHGLTFNANYEYSRNLIAQQLNPGEMQLSYQESTSDYPHHFSFTGTYHLPFGHGQRYLAKNHVMDLLVGGFQVNALYQLLSGTPLQWGGVGNSGAFDLANGVTYQNADWQVDPRNYKRAFNTSMFYTGTGTGYQNCLKAAAGCDPTDTGQPSGTYNYRTAPLYFFRADFTNNLDASVIKNFSVGERVRIEYRFEAFNVLNHVQFGNPIVSPTSLTFGTIGTVASNPRTLQQGLRVQF